MLSRKCIVIAVAIGVVCCPGDAHKYESLPKDWPFELAFLSQLADPHHRTNYQCFNYNGANVMCQVNYWEFESKLKLPEAQRLIRSELKAKAGWSLPPFKEKWAILAEAIHTNAKGKTDIQILILKLQGAGCSVRVYR